VGSCVYLTLYRSVNVHLTQKCRDDPCGGPAPRRQIKLDRTIYIKVRIVELTRREKQVGGNMTGASPLSPTNSYNGLQSGWGA